MELGFCGRDCGICDVREAYGCAGCRESGGVPPHGPCPVAACCRERDLEKCGDCQALDWAFLPEREGGPRAASRSDPPAHRRNSAKKFHLFLYHPLIDILVY